MKSPNPRRPGPKERARIAAIFDRFAAATAEPRTELGYSSPYTLLVAVVLSAQATDVSVNKATAKLYKVADTPAAMLALGEAGLTPFISSIGLFRGKAKNVIALSRLLIERHGGQVPLNREALQSLPGVGRKTASVVLNELDVEPAIAVDTHVFRVAHRLKLSAGKTPDQVETDLMRVVPPKPAHPRPSLVDPARPLRVPGPQAALRRLPGGRPLPVARTLPAGLSRRDRVPGPRQGARHVVGRPLSCSEKP